MKHEKTEEEILNTIDILEAKFDMLDESIKDGEKEVRFLEDELKEAKVLELQALRAEKHRIDKIIYENLQVLAEMSKNSR